MKLIFVINLFLIIIGISKCNDNCIDRIKESFLLPNLNNTLILTGTNLNDLGIYDKCNKNNLTNYFLIQISFEKKNLTEISSIGACLPNECDDENSRNKIILFLSENSGINKSNINIYNSKNINEKLTTPDFSNYLVFIFLLIYFTISTGLIQNLIKFSKESHNLKNINTIQTSSNITDSNYSIIKTDNDETNKEFSLLETSSQNNSKKGKLHLLFDILELFNFGNNWNKFFGDEKKLKNFEEKFNESNDLNEMKKSKESDGELKFINLIRVLLCFYIIFLHSIIICMDIPVKGMDHFVSLIKTFYMQLIVNASYVVDCFFSLTGFFLSYLALKKFREDLSTIKIFFYSVLYRFRRIWPIVIINLLVFWKLIYLLGDGPVYGLILEKELNSCSKQTPWMLLMINNWTYGLYETQGPVCFGWYWYVANDFQLYIIGVALIILYKKDFRNFLIAFIFLITLGLAFEINSLLATKYGIDIFHQGNIFSNFIDYYILLYNRCSPFWIGLTFGILYYENKYNNALGLFNKIKSRPLLMIGIFMIGWIFILFLIFFPYFIYDTDVPIFFSFLFNFLSRKIFSFSFMTIILCMAFGCFKPFQHVFDAPFLTKLSKLTFAIFLIHPALIKFTYYSLKYSIYLELFYLFGYAIAFILISTILALIFHILFEMPLENLKK